MSSRCPRARRRRRARSGSGAALRGIGVGSPARSCVEVEHVDDRRVVVGDQVDDQLTVALECVDVVEAEEGLGLVVPCTLAGVAVHDDEARAALRLPR